MAPDSSPLFVNQVGRLIERRAHCAFNHHITEPSLRANQTPIDTYLTGTAAIHTILERLQQVAVHHLSTTTPMPLTGATSAILSGRMLS